MKIQYLSFIALILVCNNLIASLPYIQPNKAYAHLREVNTQWDVYTGETPMKEIKFTTDNERIRFHLLSVVDILQKKSNVGLSSTQIESRAKLLDELAIYALEMNFPLNEVYAHRQPCFIDQYNNFCAVGYMMKVSGFENLAREIQRDQNYAYLADIYHNSVPQWALQHGFNLQELAWIQPTYGPINEYQSIGTGANADVRGIYSYQNKTYILGDFTELNNEPCSGIGVYEEGTVNCILSGLEGTLYDVTVSEAGIVYVAGAIVNDGNSYPLAVYQNNQWEFISIPESADLVGKQILFLTPDSYYLAVQNDQTHEVWRYYSSGEWAKKVTIDGDINSAETFGDKAFFGGNFSEVMIHFGTENQVFNANNLVSVEVLFGQWMTEAWMAYTGDVPSTILTLNTIGEALYIGGEKNTENHVLLTKFENDIFETLVESPDQSEGSYSIRGISPFNSTGLLLAGDLSMDMMNAPSLTYGQHLYRYEFETEYLFALGLFNQPVNAVLIYNNEIIIGGEFSSNVGQAMNHLAKSLSPVSVGENVASDLISIYPNPASDVVQVELDNPSQGFLRLTDLTGRVIHEEGIIGKQRVSIDVSHLPSQVVLVSVLSADKISATQRLVIR